MNKLSNYYYFKGNNITKFENESKSFNLNPLISNLFFEINLGDSIGFVFNNPNEKKAFIDIITGKDNQFNGYLQFGGEFFYSKNYKEIKNVIHFGCVNEFYNNAKNQTTKSFDSLWNKNNYNIFIDSIKKNIDSFNNYNHLNRFKLLSNAKQNELAFYKRINAEIFKNIEIINSYKSLLEQNEAKQNASFLIQTINSFYHKYYDYLKTRIELMYHQNVKLINLILNEFSNQKNLERDNLTKNIEKMKTELNKKNHSQNKNIDNRSKKQSSKQHSEKNLVLLLLKIQKYEYWNYRKKCKQALENVNNDKGKLNYSIKFYVNDFCYKLLKKNILLLSNLTLTEVNEFLNEFKKHYSLLLYDFGLILKNSNTKMSRSKAYRKIKGIFSMDFSSYINMSKENKDFIASKNEHEAEPKNNLQPTLDWENNIILKKTEYQKLVDEFEWEFSNNVVSVNEQFANLTKEAKKQAESFDILKKEFDVALNLFINERNNCINEIKKEQSNINYVNQWKINQVKYRTINQECMKVYSQVKNEFQQLNEFLKGKISNRKRKRFNMLVYKYEIYKHAYNCDLNILELEKNISSLSNISISKLTLVKALLSNKEILIFNDVFEKLSKSEKEAFDKIFNSLNRKKEKFVINVVNKYYQTRNVVTYVNFIYNSKNVEFGDKEVIEKNPLYLYTYKQINQTLFAPVYLERKINSLIGFESYLNDFFYDYYKIEPKHFVFGNIEEIHKWTKTFPEAFELTFDPFKIDFMKSKIQQSLNFVNNNNNSSKDDSIFESNERTIINFSDSKSKQYETKN